jgi:hypothetical protein
MRRLDSLEIAKEGALKSFGTATDEVGCRANLASGKRVENSVPDGS